MSLSSLPAALATSDLPGLPAPRRGKVRDVYDLDAPELGTSESSTEAPGGLLLVATDRLSAYDFVLRPGIPDKGKILTQLANFWFEHLDLSRLGLRHHLRATRVDDFPATLQAHRNTLAGRSIWVHNADVVPFECVARGYLAGSGYREYVQSGTVCGLALPPGLERASRLPEPIFTPATKAESGHDENVSFEVMADSLAQLPQSTQPHGRELAERLRAATLDLYQQGAEHAARQGLILADTKFEFGWIDGELALIDEVLTPDSSRYWPADAWQPGEEPPSFDKQYVRNWLDASGWDHVSEPPELPVDVVAGTRERYLEAFRRITGREPDI